MKIRKARKEDLAQYLKLVRKSHNEYTKIIDKKIKFTDTQIKKDFLEFTTSKDKIILIVEKDGLILGYLVASFFTSSYQKIGYIDFLFILNKFRRKGIAKNLVKEFNIILKKKKIKKCKLGVNIKNKTAINFYKDLGFKINHHDMEKKLKWNYIMALLENWKY